MFDEFKHCEEINGRGSLCVLPEFVEGSSWLNEGASFKTVVVTGVLIRLSIKAPLGAFLLSHDSRLSFRLLILRVKGLVGTLPFLALFADFLTGV